MAASNILSVPYYRQQFSLPNSLIYYITKNPSTSNVYEKLVQSCKYFYVKNPILLVDLLNVDVSGKCSCILKNCDKAEKIDVDTLTVRFWITGSFTVFNFQTNVCSTIISKIYRCDASYLNLTSQCLLFNEFMVLSSSVQICSFNNVKVQYPDGYELFLEDIIQNIPMIKKFYSFSKPNVSSQTVNSLINIPHFSNLSVFSLKNVPEAFDIQRFCGYIEKNQLTKFTLHFDGSISETFKQKVHNVVDELIQMESCSFVRPIITYPKMNLLRLAIVKGWHRKNL